MAVTDRGCEVGLIGLGVMGRNLAYNTRTMGTRWRDMTGMAERRRNEWGVRLVGRPFRGVRASTNSSASYAGRGVSSFSSQREMQWIG